MDSIKENLEFVLESIPTGLVVINSNGKIVMTNNTLDLFFGYKKNELEGHQIEDIVPKEIKKIHPKYVKEFFKNPKEMYLCENRFIFGDRKDSIQIPLEIVISPLNISGEIFAIASVINATDRLNRSKKSKALSELQRVILNGAGEGIYGLDLNGRTTFINPAAEKMLGWGKGELIGKKQHDMIHHSFENGDTYNIEKCPIYASFKDGKIHHIDNEVLWRKDGTNFPVSYTSTPIIDKNGDISGAVMVFQDISEKKENISKLKQTVEELENFNSAASHDLQTPLRHIRAFSDILQKKYSDRLNTEGNKYLDNITNSVIKMEILISDLLEISKLRTKASSFKTFDLNKEILDVIKLFSIDIEKYDIDVKINNLPNIYGDKTQIMQLVQNLISNSIKYRDKKRKLIILIYMEGQDKIIFEDNGIGFDSKYDKYIFEPFKRLYNEEYDGSGLGLAICKKIANRHGWKIFSESKINEGSKFILNIR